MSIDYWQMKLLNCFVFHDNCFKQIMDMTYVTSEKELSKLRNIPDPVQEDYLPFIDFTLSDSTKVKYNDFSIIFPDDGWTKLESDPKQVVGFERGYSKSYKLAPCSRSYRNMNDHHEDWSDTLFADYLKSRLNESHFDSSSDIIKWEKRSLLFSRECSLLYTPHSKYRHLHYYNRIMGRFFKRTDDSKSFYFERYVSNINPITPIFDNPALKNKIVVV